MDVGIGDGTRRDGRDVHRQLGRADVLGRQARLVLYAVPAAQVGAATDDEDAITSLDDLLELLRIQILLLELLFRHVGFLAVNGLGTGLPYQPARSGPSSRR